MATKSLSVSYRVISGVKYQRLIHIFLNYRELSYEKLSVSLDIRTPTYAFEISSAHLILKVCFTYFQHTYKIQELRQCSSTFGINLHNVK